MCPDESIDAFTSQCNVCRVCVHLVVLKQRSFYVSVYKVVVELQHAYFGVLVGEEAYVKWKCVLHDTLVHLCFVRVFGDDIQLSKPCVVDER